MITSTKSFLLVFNLQKYNDWKDGLPDLKWLDDVMPDNEKWHEWRGSIINLKNNMKDNIEIGEVFLKNNF